jgi:uncharacterized protein (TIGR02145 family)
MINKSQLLIVMFFAFVFVQCKQEPMQVKTVVKELSDFESHDGSISLYISGGKSPYDVQWSNYENDTVLKGLESGTYYVTITDSKNNIIVDTITVKQPPYPVCVDADGNSYKTSIIADQIWMIENLRVTKNAQGEAIESYLPNNSEEFEDKYGRLYTWNTVMNNSDSESGQGICPAGWHIPSEDEWMILIDNISTADKEIPDIKKSLNLYYAGFYNGNYNGFDISASFWSSTSQSENNAWKIYFHKSLSRAFRYHEIKTNAISVRCVKDSDNKFANVLSENR